MGKEGYIMPYAEFEQGWYRRQTLPDQIYVRNLVDFSRLPRTVDGDSDTVHIVEAAPSVGSILRSRIVGGYNGLGAEIYYDVTITAEYLADRVGADPERYRISLFNTGKLRTPRGRGDTRECYDIDIIAAGIFDTKTGTWINTNPLPVGKPKSKAAKAMRSLRRHQQKVQAKVREQLTLDSEAEVEIEEVQT
jgi:hypothetical protein